MCVLLRQFQLPVSSLFFIEYQPLDAKPLPLRQTEADEYMLALKQELRGCMRELPYFVKAKVKTKGMSAMLTIQCRFS